MIVYFGHQPHNNRRRTRLEFTNDIILMIAFYHLILQSDYVTDDMLKFIFGYSYVGTIIFAMGVNILAIAQKILYIYLR
jgi:hypothetical protein